MLWCKQWQHISGIIWMYLFLILVINLRNKCRFLSYIESEKTLGFMSLTENWGQILLQKYAEKSFEWMEWNAIYQTLILIINLKEKGLHRLFFT
jgi:hypothetical protein